MFEGESIREESLQLLREQANRLKMQSKEIQLRDEQVRFLKQTILALEQEKDTLQAQNAQWKTKLKQMAAEIAQYNANVVQKIYEENQDLLRQVTDLQQQLETTGQERDEALGQLRESEGRLQSHSSEKHELSTANESLKEARSKQEKRLALLEKENKQLQTKNISLQRQLDESSTQINYCSQQIDVLTQKHHDALKIAEKKLKQVSQKMAPREELEKTEKELKDTINRNKQLRTDLERAAKENEKLKFELSACRDRIISLEVQEETKSLQLQIDLENLSQSIKIGKKIAEFQSEQHQTAAAIYDSFKEANQKNASLEQQLKGYAEKLKEADIERHALLQQCRFTEVELERLRQVKEEEQQSREAQYQHRLMEIGLRLKRQEIALAGLRHKEDELEALREQREKEAEEQYVQKDAMGRTIEQLRKENFKLGEQLASAIKLCEENILSRQCISYYKYVVQDLVGIAYYLHLHLMRSRERTMKLFKPFISYYLAIHPTLAPNTASKHKNSSRFKSAVYVVVAIIRMRRERGRGKGLEWYAQSAAERREKLQNVAQHIQMLSGSILNGAKAVDVLRNSEGVYKWRVNNYLKVRLPIGDDRKIISQQLQLQDFE